MRFTKASAARTLRLPRRAGFLLMELMAALMLAGIAVVSVGLLIRQVDATQQAIERRSRQADASANGMHILRDLVERAELGVDSTRQFAGDATNVLIPTWCDMPGGWQERCVVRIALDRRADSTAIDATFQNNAQMELAILPGQATLSYLRLATAGSAWISMWGRGITPPAAVAVVRSNGDTLVFRVGDRG
jgi:hypothetical protein